MVRVFDSCLYLRDLFISSVVPAPHILVEIHAKIKQLNIMLNSRRDRLNDQVITDSKLVKLKKENAHQTCPSHNSDPLPDIRLIPFRQFKFKFHSIPFGRFKFHIKLINSNSILFPDVLILIPFYRLFFTYYFLPWVGTPCREGNIYELRKLNGKLICGFIFCRITSNSGIELIPYQLTTVICGMVGTNSLLDLPVLPVEQRYIA